MQPIACSSTNTARQLRTERLQLRSARARSAPTIKRVTMRIGRIVGARCFVPCVVSKGLGGLTSALTWSRAVGLRGVPQPTVWGYDSILYIYISAPTSMATA